MDIQKQAHRTAKGQAGHAAQLAARQAGPPPLATEPADQDADLKGMIDRHNELELERFGLEAAIMQALLKRPGQIVRYGMGGQVMTQCYHPDWQVQHVPNVLIVESLGSPG